MLVKELIELLQEVPENWPVYFHYEDAIGFYKIITIDEVTQEIHSRGGKLIREMIVLNSKLEGIK